MNRKAFARNLIITMLVSVLAGMLLVNSAAANPYGPGRWLGIVDPRSDTNPPVVSIRSPQNSTIFLQNGSVELTFFVNPPTGPDVRYPAIVEIYYTTSWNQNKTPIMNNREHITHYPESTFMDNTPSTFSGSLNVTGIPDGKQSIKVYAEYLANYVIYYSNWVIGNPAYEYSRFYMTASSIVDFMVDTAPPRVSVLSPQNQEYTSPDVPLNFVVDDASNLAYSLDGAEKVAVQGNVTLAGLASGAHNVTVYAWDLLGKMGTSETVVFTVSEPQPSLTVLAVGASGAFLAIAGLGIFVYFKKGKKP